MRARPERWTGQLDGARRGQRSGRRVVFPVGQGQQDGAVVQQRVLGAQVDAGEERDQVVAEPGERGAAAAGKRPGRGEELARCLGHRGDVFQGRLGRGGGLVDLLAQVVGRGGGHGERAVAGQAKHAADGGEQPGAGSHVVHRGREGGE